MWLALPDFAVVDEIFHLDQITRLAGGDPTHLPNITTFIYLHHVYAWLGQWLSFGEPLDYRLISALIAGILALAVILVVPDLKGEFDWKLAAQLWFLPVVYPYLPLVYTDIPALVLLLLCAWLTLRNQLNLAAATGALATWVRQPSLIWLGLLTLWAGYRRWGQDKNPLTTLWVMLPGMVVMAGFILLFLFNDSVALGDKSHHTVSINLTNVYFMLLLFAVLFLPLLISQGMRTWQFINHNRWLWLLMLAGLPVCLLTFDVSHPFNAAHLNIFIRNLTLNTLDAHPWLLAGCYFVVFFGTLSLMLWPLRDPSFKWLWLAMPLAVVFMPLIEQRYYMLGMMLWMLCREPAGDRLEWIQLLWLMLISLTLYWGIGQRWFYF
jgi:alpha-1,2-glucosyltransferase